MLHGRKVICRSTNVTYPYNIMNYLLQLFNLIKLHGNTSNNNYAFAFEIKTLVLFPVKQKVIY